ncbi:MAG: type 1 glutamine amidotransferase [Halioglobus sp.]|nr:type 1 glutamine amidotransferase [Halioglobus sp.]
MNRIGITQRVEVVRHYGERRDCLDQRWSEFILRLECIPIPLPNIASGMVPQLIEALQIGAVILSGGNSIASLDSQAEDAAPERDAFENALISAAITRKVPVVGVCRGMQLLNLYMGGSLQERPGHVAVRHTLHACSPLYALPSEVNSFHKYGIPQDKLADDLTPLAVDGDGYIEAFYRDDMPVLGIMWHPEREDPFSNCDVQLMKRFLA